MFRTLHGKLSAVLLGLLVLTALLYVPLTLFTSERYRQEANQKLNRTLAAHLVSHLIGKNLLRRDARVRQRTQAEIKQSMVLNPDIEIYILDPNGVILDYSAAPGKVKRARVSLGAIRRFLAGRDPFPIDGDDPRDPARRKIFSAAAIPEDARVKDRLKGYVYIILGGEEAQGVTETLRRSYILRLGLAMTAGTLLFALIAGFYLFATLTRRLRQLASAVERFQPVSDKPVTSSGAKTLAPSQDEIERLAAVFAHLSERVEAQVRALQQADTHRREMVSNVSHDLRTPLAALQGYLETLSMKEGQLTPQEQRNYLDTATRHAERLTRLVSELFELAKLEAREVPLHIEPFSLGELIQDVAQKFQLAAQNNDLRLETDLAADLPFVYADIGMIERVLENLIENALRYTPASGAITLALAPTDGKIVVEVRDTGRGISEQDLPHIFERYYRVESQPQTPGSAGLGLAITRRILELHDTAIQVSSAPDHGTTFTFSLPTVQGDA
jgi:signal transduction histidine kinase